MSESSRDERVKVYSFSDAGTGGRAAPTYTYVRSYWGRRQRPSMREVTVAGQASQVADEVFELPGHAVIDQDGAIRSQSGTLYKITGVEPVKGSVHSEIMVRAAYADEMQLVVVES
ncbi:MAG TPA: hypothetical protein VF042_16925 [Gemmatimonadaceae bacterium]